MISTNTCSEMPLAIKRHNMALWYPNESGVWRLTFANQDLARELICKEMNIQKRDIENEQYQYQINHYLIFELKCKNMIFKLECKKVIPKIASPQAKTSQIQTRSERVKFERGQVGDQ